MITKSSILIEYKDKSKLTDSIYKFVNALDIDFSILKYDYFDVNEYKKTLLMTHLLLTKMQNILNYYRRLIFLMKLISAHQQHRLKASIFHL